jgi:hypothetical protein
VAYSQELATKYFFGIDEKRVVFELKCDSLPKVTVLALRVAAAVFFSSLIQFINTTSQTIQHHTPPLTNKKWVWTSVYGPLIGI